MLCLVSTVLGLDISLVCQGLVLPLLFYVLMHVKASLVLVWLRVYLCYEGACLYYFGCEVDEPRLRLCRVAVRGLQLYRFISIELCHLFI